MHKLVLIELQCVIYALLSPGMLPLAPLRRSPSPQALSTAMRARANKSIIAACAATRFPNPLQRCLHKCGLFMNRAATATGPQPQLPALPLFLLLYPLGQRTCPVRVLQIKRQLWFLFFSIFLGFAKVLEFVA